MDRYESVVTETPDYRLSLEPYADKGWHFVHNEVYRLSPRVIREIREVLDIWAEFTKLRVFIAPESPANLERYAGMFGFKYSHTMRRPLDGQPCHILRRH